MGCCSSQPQNANQTQQANAVGVDPESKPEVIASEPESVTPNDTQFFTVISDDSSIHCISFLNPIDFANVCCTCKNFRSLTTLSKGLTQQYWKQQCISLCYDARSAIQDNDFDTQNWFALFMELQTVIRSEKLKDFILHRGCTLLELYNYNYKLSDENKIFPIRLIDLSVGYVVTHPVLRYDAC